MKKTLIIGGNRFLGPKLIELLMERGHEVTIFNRGNDYGQQIPSGINVITGDRRESINLDALATERYDYIYDMCCYNPKEAENVLRAIQPPEHLILLSTAAVYKKPSVYPLSEDAELGPWDSFGDYGTNKALAEQLFSDYATQHELPLTIFRPVYLLGDKNYFDREHYYFSRITKGLPILMPGRGNALIQFSFLDETAAAFADIPAKQKTSVEILNIAGNEYITVHGFIDLCAQLVGKPADIIALHTEEFGLDDEKFYDDLYPFPNLNFIVSNQKVSSDYGVEFKPLSEGMTELYAHWEKDWDGNVRQYQRELDIIKQMQRL